MKTTSLHIAFAALLSLLSLASCSRNDEVAVAEGEEGKVYVTLTLSINGEEAGSRATWEDNDNPEDGNEWENTIDDLQILIYDANNNYVGKVEDLIQLLDGRYSGTLSSDAEWTGNTNYKIMAFANCPSIDDPSNISTLDYTRANVSYIPMWGVTTAQFNLTPGVSEDIGSIDLLRAMAKVEVFMDAEGYIIDNISVDKSNPQGYCLPNGYNSVSETDRLDMEGETPASFNPYTSGTPESKAEDGQHYIYLPEYDNSTKPAKIQVTVNGETYELEFKDYENGAPKDETPYNIVRNHIYRYTITGVNDGKLIIKYKAMPWELVTSEIGYAPQPMTTNPFSNEDDYAEFISKGESKYILLPLESYRVEEKDGKVVNDYSNTQKLFNHLYENPEVGDNEARLCIITRPTYDDKIDGNQHWALKPGSAGARYYFMLTGPKGATWEAHLNDPEGNFDFSTSITDDDFAACTDKDFSKEVRMATHGIAREQPYIIQIIATHLYTGYENNPRISGISNRDTEPRFESDAYEKLNLGTNKENWKPYFRDDYLTEWGKNKWDAEEVVEAEFYITVKLADGAEYELTINPPYYPEKDDEKKKYPFYNKETQTYHRFAGTNTRIWIRQVRAQYAWPNLEYLARDLQANETGDNPWNKVYWWTKNPYWNPAHTYDVWH